jgi:hypothetical protein
VGATLEEVNYDELEENDALKLSVTALPTIRLLVEQGGKAGRWAAKAAARALMRAVSMKVTPVSSGSGRPTPVSSHG